MGRGNSKLTFYTNQRKRSFRTGLMNAYAFIIKMKDYASSGIKKIAQSVGATRSEIERTQRSQDRWSNSLRGLKNLVVGAFAAGTIFTFTNKVIDARSEYEKFQAVLTNTFQSADIGDAALNMLTDFAAKTPFQLNNLTGAFVKLVNRGFNPTRDELTNLGDLASSQGKSFDQLTEAILDAQTGEFERLKEFGIKASKQGDMVKLSFKGVTKEVQNNDEAIRNAILEYGKMDGVAGSMEAISKTLGGRISNLGDTWNNFLVAVGGESGVVFTGVIDMLSNGLEFLTEQLPKISKWFEILWGYIEPVGTALKTFIKEALGIDSAGSAMDTFGNIMTGVLSVVDIFTTGLTTLIGWLMPFADVIGIVTGAWWLFNTAVALSPVGWIIIGIMALITVIGLVTKYTSGWGESWTHTVNGVKLIWQAYVEYVKTSFNAVVMVVMGGIDKIKLAWYEAKQVLGMGDKSENQKMIDSINAQMDARSQAVKDGAKEFARLTKAAKDEFMQVGVTIDKEGIKKDFAELKNKFKGLGQKDTSTSAYDLFVEEQNKKKEEEEKKKTTEGGSKSKGDSIVSGGSKMTHINITIGKLQDKTEIHVSKVEKGLDKLGEKVQEMLLRSVNSVNQMQTG